MKDFREFNSPIKILFTDIDDTLTTDGRLPAETYSMLWKLSECGIDIVPVTGRPAGWCEMIARMWPVKAVIGENGAFYFSYQDKKMIRYFAVDETQRKENTKRLQTIEKEIFAKVPNAALASDQFTRLFDLAIDFCEDVAPLDKDQIQNIVEIFQNHGAQAKVSSIHVNGWFGNYNKKTLCEKFFKKEYKKPFTHSIDECLFIGDSPNDEPMFEHFQHSFAVANILPFVDSLKHPPKYVTKKSGGQGFCELGNHLLKLIKTDSDSRLA